MLQVLDDGRLTDSKWKTVDFKNTLIILTSNIWSDVLLEKAKEKKKEKTTVEDMMPLLLEHFRPEFLNRIDDIILFNPLSEKEIKGIVDIQLNNYLKDLLSSREIKIDLSDAAKKFIASKGWNPQFWARPLKRALQNYLLDELALEIIEGKIKNGSNVSVDLDWEKLTFKTKD